jgi:hypothetical protein
MVENNLKPNRMPAKRQPSAAKRSASGASTGSEVGLDAQLLDWSSYRSVRRRALRPGTRQRPRNLTLDSTGLLEQANFQISGLGTGGGR